MRWGVSTTTCIPCRRRKVRCDLGPVDNPSDPPCVRCRRESKECYFSATRRKRKTDDALDPDAEEYIIRNGRKRLFTGNARIAWTPVDSGVTLSAFTRNFTNAKVVGSVFINPSADAVIYNPPRQIGLAVNYSF